jgi:hypothetical protein
LMNWDSLLCWKKKYNRYALLNERVLQVAKRELKNFMISANVMFILNSRKNAKAEPLKCCVSNCFVKNAMNVKTTTDLLLELIPLFKVYLKLPPNKKRCFCKDVILQLQKHPFNWAVKQTYQGNFSGRNKTTHQDTFLYFEWGRYCIQSQSR